MNRHVPCWLILAAVSIAPARAWSQTGVGPVTPVAPQRVAVPEPKLPENPQSPTDFNAVPKLQSTPTPPAGGSGGEKGPVTGYSGSDMVIGDVDPALYGGVRRTRRNIPPYHVVREGDTLWDVCSYYYGDPWSWPQLWAYNSRITNPHWIYPGDKVRLLGGAPAKTKGERVSVTRTYSGDMGPLVLRQNGFADPREMKDSGFVEGSKVERLLLSERDEIYIGYKGRFKPKPGKSYSVYRVKKRLVSGEGRHVGYQVTILGTVRVKRAPDNKAAVGVITESVRSIERGDRVGELRRRYRRTEVKRADRNLSGTVIGGLRDAKHHGRFELVFIDRGTSHGVQNGHRFLVLQRGDGYRRLLQDQDLNNPRFPREAIAEIAVVDARKNASVGYLNRAIKEVKEGDFIRMRKGY